MFTPSNPYLAKTNIEAHPVNERCPQVEENFYCPQQSFSPPDNCTLQMMQGNLPTDCHILEVYNKESIVEQVTINGILTVPANSERLKYLNVKSISTWTWMRPTII